MGWSRRKSPVSWVLPVLLALANPAAAQEDRVTPNYRGANLEEVVEAVGRAIGKTFVIDPTVGLDQRFTLIGSQPMTTEAFYQAFLSMLSAHGIVAVPSGPVVRLAPDRTLRILPEVPLGQTSLDELQTRVLNVANVDAQTLVPILRPMMSPGAHLAAHAPTNVLILSDRGSSVSRVVRVVRRIDIRNEQPIEIIPLEHAGARNLVRVLGEIATGSGAPSNLAIADDRTNSILLGGEQDRRLQLRALIAHLDTPLTEAGATQVRYIRYANAVSLAEMLSAQFAGSDDDGKPIQVSADEDTNSLIIDAPPGTLRTMLAVVEQLDIRRAQVLVEALIAEVNAEQANRLGVNWAAYDPKRVLGSTDFPASGTSLRELVAGSLSNTDQGRQAAAEALGPGAGFAVGRVRKEGLSFAALISAVENTVGANILGTPMLVTLDNEEATINVGQEVPFVTGSYASSGINPSGTDGQLRPFTTVNRSQVGLTLKITPRINQGSAVRLEIKQELSELAPSVAGAVDLVTNTRLLETAVIVEDGGTLVLGGLIQDKIREGRQEVPWLGRVPLVGTLFRASSVTREKTNLMLFIRPSILRDASQADAATNVKYDYLRRQQLIDVLSKKDPLLPEAMGEAFGLREEADSAASVEEEEAQESRETAAPD